MSSDHLRVDHDDGLLRLHLDKPQRRNALDDEMVADLIDAIDAAGRDESVRAVLVTAEGDHFCSGFDIITRNETAKGARPRVGSIQRRLPSQSHRLIPMMCSVQVPIVCAVRGWASGIGLHLLAASDFAVVADDARIWEPFSQRGFTPDSGGTWLLPRLIGMVRARQLLLLGRTISGVDAVEWGLAHANAPAADVDAEAETLARELSSAATVSIGLTKWLLHTGDTRDLNDHLANEAFALELSSRSEDFREGLAAFKEKRDPRFTGR